MSNYAEQRQNEAEKRERREVDMQRLMSSLTASSRVSGRRYLTDRHKQPNNSKVTGTNDLMPRIC
jgi:hypothetical protein